MAFAIPKNFRKPLFCIPRDPKLTTFVIKDFNKTGSFGAAYKEITVGMLLSSKKCLQRRMTSMIVRNFLKKQTY